MPLSTQVIDEGRGLLHLGVGTVSGEDFLFVMTHVAELGPVLRNVRYVVFDLSSCKLVSRTASEDVWMADKGRELIATRPQIAVFMVASPEKLEALQSSWEGAHAILGPFTTFCNSREELEAKVRDYLLSGDPPPAAAPPRST